uniref:Uncharacterized protein n=1 Tax=Candidatus Kentrum sp. FM TaxID=2126340 RepID=A0A450WE68_9GAMM|nr:MAG: hypothetical protein BECKFM1743B_GA0114221_103652 [Candidatus Kentron sp. FM]
MRLGCAVLLSVDFLFFLYAFHAAISIRYWFAIDIAIDIRYRSSIQPRLFSIANRDIDSDPERTTTTGCGLPRCEFRGHSFFFFFFFVFLRGSLLSLVAVCCATFFVDRTFLHGLCVENTPGYPYSLRPCTLVDVFALPSSILLFFDEAYPGGYRAGMTSHVRHPPNAGK